MKIDYTKAINYIAILYALTLPLSRAAIVILTIVITVFWILEGDLKNKLKNIIRCKVIVAILIFLSFNFISLLWVESENLYHALNYIKKYWYFIVIFPLYTSLKSEYIIKSIYAFLIGMTISSIISLGIYFDWWQVKEVTKDSLSPFMYHVFYSLFLAFSSLISIILIKENRNIYLKIVFAAITVLFLTILFLGIARTGQVIFIFGIFYLFIRNYQNRRKVFLSLLIFFTILLGTFYNFNDKFKERVNLVKKDMKMLIDNNNYCSSLGGRAFTWRVAYDITKEHPLIGLGIVDHLNYLKYEIEHDKEFSKCGIKNLIGYFHGQYIEILSQLGIVGLFLFLSIFYYLFTLKLNSRVLEEIKSIFILIFLLIFIVDVPFRKQFALGLFAFISAILTRYKHANYKL